MERFEELQFTKQIESSKVDSHSNIDLEEERLRNLLKPSRAKNECACGIVKSACSYHKGT